MKVEEISKHFQALSEEKKYRFLHNFNFLSELAKDAMALRGPYRFVLDSNIIMRFEDLKRKDFHEGLLSVMLFFDLFRSQSKFCADLIVTPVVFYEFFRLQNVSSLKEYWQKFQSIRSLIEDSLDTEVLFEKLDTFESTEHYIRCIEHDAEVIKNRLINIRTSEFRYDAVRPPGGVMGALRADGMIEVLSPIFAADHLYEDVETHYFHPFYVGLFLKDHIAQKIESHPQNNFSAGKEDYILRDVVHLDNKDRVKGLADIELLWKCNVRDQFNMQAMGNYHPASIPLTVDQNLFFSLKKMSGFGVSSGEIYGGEDIDEATAKMESSFDDANRRMSRAKEQQISFERSCIEYLESISPLFTLEKDENL